MSHSKCRGPNCGYIVNGRESQSLLFHVILCPDIPLRVREYWWSYTKDKNKPPLLKHPLKGMTVAHARNYVANALSHMMDMLVSDFINPGAWDIDPIYAKFSTKRQDIIPTCPANQCSAVEQNIANMLLARLFVDENLPFALLDKKNRQDRALPEFAKFVRSGIKVPSGYLLRGLISEYHTII